jgi:hypothetical protein
MATALTPTTATVAANERTPRVADPNARSVVAYTGLFSYFNPSQDIVTNIKDSITEGVWTPSIGGVLTAHYTSSIQSASSGMQYLDIYQEAATSTTAEVQYSIAYGSYYGSGSALYGNSIYSPTKITYAQYSNILLPFTSDKFVLANGTVCDEIAIINFKRERLKEQLDPGGWELHLSGSNVNQLSLIDDFSINPAGTPSDGGIVYNIVSGSNTNSTPVYNPSAPVYYGLAYPEHGIIVLNASGSSSVNDIINVPWSFAPSTTTSINQNNNFTTYRAINSSSYFAARNKQTINSTYYFVRVLNNAFNYSNNPTFTTGSLGDVRFPTMIKDPKVYITTVGLYNDNNELLAIAKVSQPILKAFNKEVTLRIRLDF